MQILHATHAASISELKQNPTRIINNSQGKPVVILNHNTAAAYLVPADTYERMLEMLDDKQLEYIVNKRLNDDEPTVRVDLDEL